MAKKAKKKTNTKTLNALAKGAPKTIDTKALGTLQLTAVLSDCLEYSVDCELAGETTELVLYSKEHTGDMDTTIESASKLVKGFKKVKSRLNDYIGSVVLKAVNTHLRPKDPITATALKKQLQLRFIDIHPNGDASFSYEAGDVLLGHALMLYGTSDGAIKDFDTPG
jgi:hypothetical protein